MHTMQESNKQNTRLGGGKVMRVQTDWSALAQNSVNKALLRSFSEGSIQHPGGFRWYIIEIHLQYTRNVNLELKNLAILLQQHDLRKCSIVRLLQTRAQKIAKLYV